MRDRLVRKYRMDQMKKTTVYLSPDIVKILAKVESNGRDRGTVAYIEHAVRCFHAGEISPLPGTVKLPLPEVCGIRSRIAMVWGKSEFIKSGLEIRIPLEWYNELGREAILAGMRISTLIKARVGLYLDKEDIKKMAFEKNVPYSYMLRELLPVVFPNLALCDFGPPGRRNIDRRDDGRRKSPSRRKVDRTPEQYETDCAVRTLTTESSNEAKAFYETLKKE